MSDRLRESLERVNPPFDALRPTDLRVIVAAARRWLALTETGPDYEAAAKELMGSVLLWSDDGVEYGYCKWEEASEAMRDSARDNARFVVDAALADYLTEEET